MPENTDCPVDEYKRIVQLAASLRGSDPAALLLKASSQDVTLMKAVANQLEGYKDAATKWPSLTCNDAFMFPPRLNRQQSSSEIAASFKARQIICAADSVADLSGGMAIDSFAFAAIAKTVDYVEQVELLVSLAEYNSQVLHLSNIHCHCAESMKWLASSNRHFDWIFLDPARRDSSGRKMVAFEDCSPNVLAHLPLLLDRSDHLLVKASPMVDLVSCCGQLVVVEQIVVLAVNHECKEVLFVVGSQQHDIPVRCVDIWNGGMWDDTFSKGQNDALDPSFATDCGRYIYEPHAALMKSCLFRCIASRYNVEELSPNTHLFTSDSLVAGFPGRVFEVESEVPLNRKAVRMAFPDGKAHVISRNYPVSAAKLQQQVGLSEGGDSFLVATQISSRRCAFRCRLVAGRR